MKRRADGSACPHCAERLLESLPALLPSRTPVPHGDPSATAPEDRVGEELQEVAATRDTRGRASFTHLRGGTPPDLGPSPHQPDPADPA